MDSDSYRYGFQGQERDDEVKGSGNSYNYKYRMHDPRLGRFFAVDPLYKEYPEYSPYSFSGNKVIHAVELEGLEERYILFSNIQVEKVRAAFKKKDYMEVARIVDYAMNNGAVDDNCNPSKYIARKLEGVYNMDFLTNNTATAMMFEDNTLQDGIMVFQYSIFVGTDENGNSIIENGELGTIDLKLIKKAANTNRIMKWHAFIKTKEGKKYISEFSDQARSFANGGDVSDPPISDESLKWPSGAFDSTINSANRTNQVQDIASWYTFIEDYKANPDKYSAAAKKYIEKFYGEAISEYFSEYEKVNPNEFKSYEDFRKNNPPRENNVENGDNSGG